MSAALERVPADSVFHKRISIVQSTFTLAHHGTVMHHATVNVYRGSQNDSSRLSPNELINEASRAIKANRDLTAFKRSTVEGKPAAAYADFDSRRGLYRKFIKGDLLLEVLSRLVTGLENNPTPGGGKSSRLKMIPSCKRSTPMSANSTLAERLKTGRPIRALSKAGRQEI